MDILNIVSNKTINVYYDPSLKKVICYFYSSDRDQSDVVGYLLDDMTWDLREIVGEKSILNDDSEVVTIKHKHINLFEKNSNLDVLIKKYIGGLIKNDGDNNYLKMINKILTNESYGDLQ